MKRKDLEWLDGDIVDQLGEMVGRIDDGGRMIASMIWDAKNIQDTATTWFKELCRFCFSKRTSGHLVGAQKLRPLLIPFMTWSGILDLLVNPDARDVVGTECINALNNLWNKQTTASERYHYRHKTVAEGCYLGSDVARTLALLEIIGREHTRIEETERIRKRHQEDERCLAALQK